MSFIKKMNADQRVLLVITVIFALWQSYYMDSESIAWVLVVLLIVLLVILNFFLERAKLRSISIDYERKTEYYHVLAREVANELMRRDLDKFMKTYQSFCDTCAQFEGKILNSEILKSYESTMTHKYTEALIQAGYTDEAIEQARYEEALKQTGFIELNPATAAWLVNNTHSFTLYEHAFCDNSWDELSDYYKDLRFLSLLKGAHLNHRSNNNKFEPHLNREKRIFQERWEERKEALFLDHLHQAYNISMILQRGMSFDEYLKKPHRAVGKYTLTRLEAKYFDNEKCGVYVIELDRYGTWSYGFLDNGKPLFSFESTDENFENEELIRTMDPISQYNKKTGLFDKKTIAY